MPQFTQRRQAEQRSQAETEKMAGGGPDRGDLIVGQRHLGIPRWVTIRAMIEVLSG